MAWRLRLAPEALSDIERHRVWLTQEGSGRRAHRNLAAIVNAIDGLTRAPLRWPLSPDHHGYRNRIIGGYVIIYRVDADAGAATASGDISVLRVFAPRQDRRILV
jgi:plasmid stabilization system protein ParE